MSQPEVLKELLAEEAAIKKRIESLDSESQAAHSELQAIQRVIGRIRAKSEPELRLPTQDGKDRAGKERREPLTLTPAIRHILESNPSREFTPMKVRDELEVMREHGEFTSAIDKLLPTVHAVLQDLAKRGIFTKRKSGKKAFYKLA
jgi:hypothetical protein